MKKEVKEVKTKNRQFVQLENVKLKGLIAVECQCCYRYFGLDPWFVEKVSEVAFKYTCPYCGKSHTLKD